MLATRSQPLPRAARIICLLSTVVAAAFTAQLFVFAFTADSRWAIAPSKEFFVPHWCPLGWMDALSRAQAGASVYTFSLREPVSGTDPDPFLYAPPFLLVPRLLFAITGDLTLLRVGWLLLQVLTTLTTFVLVAAAVGGVVGTRMMWLVPTVWVAPAFLIGLQIGNPHVSVLAAAITGVLLIRSSRWVAGSGLLAAAITVKLFPAVLLAYFAGQRQWRALAGSIAWLAALSIVAVLLFGPRVVTDYIGALPTILDGSSVRQFTENRDIAPSNHSVLGATRKLAAIGMEQFTTRRGQLIETAYGVGIVILALVLGWRASKGSQHGPDLVTVLIVCLALLNLASFRSPFLPDAYAFVGTVWMCTLLLARREGLGWKPVVAFVIGWIAMAPIWGGNTAPPEPFTLIVVFSLIVQVVVFALNLHSARL
jgi:hypothetical protein